jgi:hypothetical protein
VPSARRLRQTLGHASSLTMRASLLFVVPPALSRARRDLPQARHHRSAEPVAAWFLCHRRSNGPCLAFAESARWRRIESKQGGHVPWRIFRLGTKPRFRLVLLSRGQVAAIPHIRPAPKCKVISGVGHAVRHASLDMLRHPNENTKHGYGSPSAA